MEHLLDVAKEVADVFAAKYGVDHDIREDWRQVAATAVIEVVNSPAPEIELSPEDLVRRKVRDDLRTESRKWLRERKRYLQPEEPEDDEGHAVEPTEPENARDEFLQARSLNPQPDTIQNVEDVGMVQTIMFAQCSKHHPFHGLDRLDRLDLKPRNKQALLELAVSVSSGHRPWLTQMQGEAALLVVDLRLTEEEAAAVLSRSREGVKKSIAQFKVKGAEYFAALGTQKRNPQPL